MNRFVYCVCLLLLLACSVLCRAGDAKTQRGDAAIEKVVAASTEAVRKGDWNRYADLVHPESLQDYKSIWLPVLQAAPKKGPETQADLLALFDKATDLKSVIALKPKEFFVRSMKGMAATFRREGIPSNLNGDEKIIGTVHEGDDQAYVVVRTRRKFGGAAMTQVEVVGLKRSGTEWKMMLPDSVRIMAETFRRTGWDTEKSGPVTDRAVPEKGR
jgi:hypothetical protein